MLPNDIKVRRGECGGVGRFCVEISWVSVEISFPTYFTHTYTHLPPRLAQYSSIYHEPYLAITGLSTAKFAAHCG
jgi:hypothetical protein